MAEIVGEVSCVHSNLQRVNHEFGRYFLVSLFSLGCDFSILLLGSLLVHYTVAAVVGFLSGAIVHYLLSVRIVFRRRKLKRHRKTEFAVFLSTAAAGLLVSVVTISACVEWLGVSLVVAKSIAAGASFLFGYLTRKFLLF